MFAEKLDFLMKLTGARNSVMGRAAHVDASTVSRLRSGKRELPKRQSFLPLMCAFFSRNITSSYQKQSAADAVSPGQAWPEARGKAEQLLFAWLMDEKPSEGASFAGLMSNIANFSFASTPSVSETDIPEPTETGDTCFIGNAGKCKAVLRFLSAVAAAEEPRTLLLYSDEALDWLTEDAAFSRQWARLMSKVISNGNRIRIIHTIGRTLDEMLKALEKWLGVYMTGAVEPYYCPKLRDGIARRTLFIAPGLAAICASSVGTNTRDALNFYTSNALAIHALEVEFINYFELCVPLMRIFTRAGMGTARELLRDLLGAKGDTVIVQSVPSLSTMPQRVAQSIQARCGDCEMIGLHQETVNAFRACVADHCVYESFPLIDPADFRDNAVAVSAVGSVMNNGLVYTREEYVAHLTGVLEALKEHENYYVLIPQAPFLPSNMALYHKARTGTVLVRTDEPCVAFAINEDRMTAALNEYLMLRMESSRKPSYRKSIVERISSTISAFQCPAKELD